MVHVYSCQGQYSETYIEIAELFNTIVSSSRNRQDELNRVITQVIDRGDFTVRMDVGDAQGLLDVKKFINIAKGGWKAYTTSINSLIENLTQPIIEVTGIIQAVSNGDLSGRIF
jgi:methyl-accepting chemotaxis protein